MTPSTSWPRSRTAVRRYARTWWPPTSTCSRSTATPWRPGRTVTRTCAWSRTWQRPGCCPGSTAPPWCWPTPSTPAAARSRWQRGRCCAYVSDTSGSWENSNVWHLTTRSGATWYLKQHPSRKFHTREVTAYAQWTPALGPGRTPELVAADPALSAVTLTALPGISPTDRPLPPDREREVHRQLGQLLSPFHTSDPPHPPVGAGAATSTVERNLAVARLHLVPGDETIIRQLATRLTALAPLPEVPTHGDAQLRKIVWKAETRIVGIFDFERAEYGPAVRDLIRLEYGPWEGRAAFFVGYGQGLTRLETSVLHATAALDALSGIAFGITAGDPEVIERAHRTLRRLRTDSGL
ncbi:aminoglycoside phosphotransferase family protein [Streptomyces sp. SID13666]|uniref:aminoglycoside phosphotransferase family protein n=1 Tax=unclassified Streptomyces TaxID=2593676 RepID=UPI0013C035BB|nr:MULTISPECIES: aminoglycoside phosphotransferase family protein [unclassified Streptomyces]NEA55329.1 aminoglycoside phosphotransferase family protein [Streptomyces sp. SID13666]NEA73535.1 aminoglycoside phosphotransferase family protein [Streptomyces sp. SID13588]